MEIRPGEVLLLAGENGAGKSTLIKILGGVYTDYEGTIQIEGKPIRLRSPLDANEHGISIIHQELSLIPGMTVAENIFLGRSLAKAGFIREKAECEEAQRLLDRLKVKLDVRQKVENLPIALQQLTEIAKAVARRHRVIVMDEPTSSLNASEVETLFSLIQDLKQQQCGIVYITHKMEEIERIADRITVLRDGRQVGTALARDLPPRRLIEWMVGRAFEQGDSTPPMASPGPERLRLANLSLKAPDGKQVVSSISLAVQGGEVLGLAGLQGSGASELLRGLFGAFDGRISGGVFLDGQLISISTPRQAIRQGIALVTNDRKLDGLVLSMSVAGNITLADLKRLFPGGWLRAARETQIAEEHARVLSLRAPSLESEANALSGGNQQKVVLAKWMQTRPRVLLLDEPTRGVDVGAKQDIYAWIHQLAAQGHAILLITSELPEMLALCHRVVVLHLGRQVAEFDRGQATPNRILEAAMGHGVPRPVA